MNDKQDKTTLFSALPKKVIGRKPLRQKVEDTLPLSEERLFRILEIRVMIKERDEARLAGNYVKADTMREQLEKKYDIDIVDQRDGPSGWKFKDGSSNKLPPGTKIPEQFQELLQPKKKRAREESDGRPSSSAEHSQQISKKQKSLNETSPSKKKSPAVTSEIERNRALVASLMGSTNLSSRNVNGVIIEEVRMGNGRAAKNGDRLQMQYVGRLKSNNKVFDSSKKPFAFQLGRGEVIKGWDIGCNGMMVGGQRKLTIPPEKAYGKSGAPPTIPPNATLTFDVTLVSIR